MFECVHASFSIMSIRGCFFLHLHLSPFGSNEMHLDTCNFIMLCNNTSLCDGKQAARGQRRSLRELYFDIRLE